MDTCYPAPYPDLRAGSLLRGAWVAFRSRPGLMLGLSLAGFFAPHALVQGVLDLLEAHVLAPGNLDLQRAVLQGAAQPFVTLFLAATFPVALRVWLDEEARFSMVFRAFSGQRFRSLVTLVLAFSLAGLAFVVLLGLVILAAVMLQPAAKSMTAYGLAGLVALLFCMLLAAQAWLLAVFGPAWLAVQEADMKAGPALRLARELTRGHRRKLAWLAAIAMAEYFALPFFLATALAITPLFFSVFPVACGMVLAIAALLLLGLPLVQLMLAGAYEELVRAYALQVSRAAACPAPAPAGAAPARA